MAQPLLIHACCGPCSLEPIRLLREEGFEPTILWTNPNISPIEEHQRRLDTLLDWAKDVGHIEVIVGKDDRDLWEKGVSGLGFDREKRCRSCYAVRLKELCVQAKRLGFTHVSTTLAVSPYQLFDTCEDVLKKMAAAHGLTAVWRDFRAWYPAATEESRELGMYRQNYCGCRYSAAEAALDRQHARDERKKERKNK